MAKAETDKHAMDPLANVRVRNRRGEYESLDSGRKGSQTAGLTDRYSMNNDINKAESRLRVIE